MGIADYWVGFFEYFTSLKAMIAFKGVFFMEKFKTSLYGISIGFVNGIFGSGGGLILVPLLKKLGLSQKESHATSIFIIYPITLISGIVYIFRNSDVLTNSLLFIPLGMVGGIIGATFLKKINPRLLRLGFGVLMIILGGKMVLGI